MILLSVDTFALGLSDSSNLGHSSALNIIPLDHMLGENLTQALHSRKYS